MSVLLPNPCHDCSFHSDITVIEYCIKPSTPCSICSQVKHECELRSHKIVTSSCFLHRNLLISMCRLVSSLLILHHSLVGDVGRCDDHSRMTAMAPVVLLVLDHVHLMTPFGDVRTGLEIHGRARGRRRDCAGARPIVGRGSLMLRWWRWRGLDVLLG